MSTTNVLKTQRTALEAKMVALEAKVEALEASVAKTAKSSSSKKAKDPDAPKREPNWWIKATQRVRGILKGQIEADNLALEDGRKIAGTAPTTVSSMLKDAGKLTPNTWEEIEEADVLDAYETYKHDPPAPKPKKVSAASSVASEGSKASKSKFADLSDEEKASKRSEAAKKAAATRKANKAKKEAAVVEAPPPVEEAPPPVEEDSVLEAKPWKGNIGKGVKDYERISYQGQEYIYTQNGQYLGVWDEKSKKLDSTVPDIGA